MSRRRVTVEQWIAEALADTDKGAPCSGIALVHQKAIGVGTDEIHTKEIQGTTASSKQLAEFFINKACAYAQDLPGTQTFRLLAFYGKGEPQAAFPFTVFEGALTAGENVAASKHEPSTTGLLAQLMKHNENIMSMHQRMTEGFLGMLVTRDLKHQEEKAEMNLIMRDILLNLRKEDHAMALEQKKFQRESEERQMLGRALPSLLNVLSGREVIPESHADSQLVEALALKVEPQHLQMLGQMGIFDQNQLMILANRFKKIRDEHEARRAALATIPPEDKLNVDDKTTVG